MQTRPWLLIIAFCALGGCAAPKGTYPSLEPRAAESIDPRVPIPSEVVAGPADASLSANLAALVDQAQAGDSAFRGAVSDAERLARAAGAMQSESWIAAQQALSAAQAARGPTTRALGDIDALASTALEKQGGIQAGNLAAIRAASARVSTIDNGQAARIEAIEDRLGL
jgi:hypothetical protein